MADDLSVSRVVDTSRDGGKQNAPGKRRPARPKPAAASTPRTPAVPPASGEPAAANDETPRETESSGGLDLLV